MAMNTQAIQIGIDVAKEELVIYRHDLDQLDSLPNTIPSIRRWLKTLPEQAALAVEATGTYHMPLTEQAHRAGHSVFVIDGYQLKHYRESVRARAKTYPFEISDLVCLYQLDVTVPFVF